MNEHEDAWHSRRRWPLSVEGSALALAALFLLLPALLIQPQAFGDSGEYLLSAESLLNHGTPDLRPQDFASMEVRAGRQSVGGSVRGMSAYRISRTGALYAQHFWAYSAATLPIRVLLRAVCLHEYKAFQLTNALLLLGATAVTLHVAPYPRPWRLLTAGLLLASPLAWFTMLPHTEVFSASFVVMALACWCRGALGAAVLAAALASLQNPPLVLLVGFLWLVALRAYGRRSSRHMLLATVAALPAALPFAFNMWAFGTPSLIAAENVHPALIRPDRAFELIYDLNIGVARMAPLTLLLAVAGTAVALVRRTGRGFVLSAWTLVAAMAHACSGMLDWNHGTSGPSRYSLWLFPLLVWMIPAALSGARSLVPVAAAGIVLAAQLVSFVAHGGFHASSDYLQHSWPARLVLRHWPSLYAPTHEIFAERTIHDETRPEGEGPFVYVDEGRCRKALAQKRHAEALLRMCGAEPPEFTRFRSFVTQRGRRDEWTYVDY